MKIKVCGMRDTDNIKAIAALRPDYMGFILYSGSPRFVSDMAATDLDSLPNDIYKTAVFVNEDAAVIDALIAKHRFNAIQLHGSESPEFADLFRDRVEVWKAFGVDERSDFTQLNDYANKVDYFLFDTKTKAHGGSGKTFDWGILNKYTLDVPFFLSGGLGPDNVNEIKNIKHPQFYGVDLNSKFETAPGLKDAEKLQQAFKTIKQITTHEIRS